MKIPIVLINFTKAMPFEASIYMGERKKLAGYLLYLTCSVSNSILIKLIPMNMKTCFFIVAFSITGHLAAAQLVAKSPCPPFAADIMAGSVNGLFPKSAIEEVRATLPCFSEIVEKDSALKCAGVFYADRSIHFYTARQYIEIGEKFKGTLTPALMGTSRNNLFKLLGHPKLKDTNWDAFQMGYGTLVLYYNAAGKINKIQMCSKNTDAIKLCQ